MDYSNLHLKPEIRTVCFDIDGTLIDERVPGAQIHPRHLGGNYLLELLARYGAQHSEKAESEILDYIKENLFWDYDDIIVEFGLDYDRVMASMREWHLGEFVVLWDRVRLLHELYRRGYQIQVISNNPYMGCLMKLELAEIVGSNGIGLLSGVHGSNNGLGQKHDPAFWRRVLELTGVPAGHMAMIGDNPLEDSYVPLQAGFGQAIIVQDTLNLEELSSVSV
tara:strand:- start:12513 stop:13178 length:666 start_codon:yes stop_codon:yes gene_type:complete